MARLLLAAAAAALGLLSVASAAIPDEDWGYVDVRPGAHMFWWLYGSTSAAAPRAETPLVMWLQGGPGASSTGYGNFGEMGPLDISLQPRNTTWVQAANVIYVDQPVGTGYSYVDELSLLPTNNTAIAADLVSLFSAFLAKYPEFSTAPFYVMCESYGGKMTTGFAQALLDAIDAGGLKANFKGIGLGDSWISPIDFVDSWGPFLRTTSLMDANQLAQMQPTVTACDTAVSTGQWTTATNLWGDVENYVEVFSDGADFYNWLLHNVPDEVVLSEEALSLAPAGINQTTLARLYARHVAGYGGAAYANGRLGDALSDLMNGPIKAKLGSVIPASVTWGGQSDAVFSALSGDFMRPVVTGVDALLSGGRINVTVYEGQLDLICDTPGAEAWMARLGWNGIAKFNSASKTPLYAHGAGATDAFYKSFGTLSYYTIMNAGHMVPSDNGPMALLMLQRIIGTAA